MKKTAVVEKGKEVKDLEELLWDKEQINQLKEGLKKYANIKEAKEKFKLISEMVGKPQNQCVDKVKEMQTKIKK